MSMTKADGTGIHDLAGLTGLDVNGPDTWSPDARWIYFGAGDASGPSCRGQVPCIQHAFRVDVVRGVREQLTPDGLSTPAVASSPDGTKIVFNVDAGTEGWDLWIAESDGSDAHLLLKSGGIGSWSADGELVIEKWKPTDGRPGGLSTIKADGTGLNVLVPFDTSCRQGADDTCVLGFGWGQARP
jgi:Tol biopolymer transport system component